VSVCQFIINKNRNSSVFVLQLLDHGSGFCVWHFQTRPAIPLEGCRLRQSAEAGDQTAGGHRESIRAIIGTFDGNGKPIGYKQQPARVRLGFFDYGRHRRGSSRCLKVRRDGTTRARRGTLPTLFVEPLLHRSYVVWGIFWKILAAILGGVG
jgi:hypothetical protein